MLFRSKTVKNRLPSLKTAKNLRLNLKTVKNRLPSLKTAKNRLPSLKTVKIHPTNRAAANPAVKNPVQLMKKPITAQPIH